MERDTEPKLAYEFRLAGGDASNPNAIHNVGPVDYRIRQLLAVGNAVSILRRTLFRVAGFHNAEKTLQIKLLAKRPTGGIQGRLVQRSAAPRLANTDEHQSDDNNKDRTTEVFFHEVPPSVQFAFRSECGTAGKIDLK